MWHVNFTTKIYTKIGYTTCEEMTQVGQQINYAYCLAIPLLSSNSIYINIVWICPITSYNLIFILTF